MTGPVNSIASTSPTEQAPKPSTKFTVLGRFRQLGKEIDPSKNWDSYSKVEYSSFGEGFNLITGSSDNRFISGIMETEGEKRKATYEFSLKDKSDTEVISGVFKNSLDIFSGNKRAQLFIDLHIEIENLLKENKNYTSQELEFRLVSKVVESLPDRRTKEEVNLLDIGQNLNNFFTNRSDTSQDLDSTKEIVTQIIKSISTKMDQATFNIYMQHIEEAFRQKIFDKGYKFAHLLSEGWLAVLLASRNRDFQTIEQQVPTFPIKDQIRNDIQTIEQLKDILISANFKPLQGYYKKNSIFHEEVVSADTVVGVEGCDSWIGQDRKDSNNGLNEIWGRVNYFKNNDLHFISQEKPINAIKIKDELYILEDGKNLFAALKALGVSQIPLLVVEGDVVPPFEEGADKNRVNSII